MKASDLQQSHWRIAAEDEARERANSALGPKASQSSHDPTCPRLAPGLGYGPSHDFYFPYIAPREVRFAQKPVSDMSEEERRALAVPIRIDPSVHNHFDPWELPPTLPYTTAKNFSQGKYRPGEAPVPSTSTFRATIPRTIAHPPRGTATADALLRGERAQQAEQSPHAGFSSFAASSHRSSAATATASAGAAAGSSSSSSGRFVPMPRSACGYPTARERTAAEDEAYWAQFMPQEMDKIIERARAGRHKTSALTITRLW